MTDYCEFMPFLLLAGFGLMRAVKAVFKRQEGAIG
jgi:hypothetical protein